MLRYMRYPSENLTLHCFHHFSISGWYLIRKQVFGIIPISFPKTGSFHDLVETYSQQTFVIFIQRRANNIPNPAAPLGSRGETWRPSQRLLLLLSAFETNYQYLNKFPRYPLESRALYVFFGGKRPNPLESPLFWEGKFPSNPAVKGRRGHTSKLHRFQGTLWNRWPWAVRWQPPLRCNLAKTKKSIEEVPMK